MGSWSTAWPCSQGVVQAPALTLKGCPYIQTLSFTSLSLCFVIWRMGTRISTSHNSREVRVKPPAGDGASHGEEGEGPGKMGEERSRKGEKIGEGKVECLSMRANGLSPPGSGQLLFSSIVGRNPEEPRKAGGWRREEGRWQLPLGWWGNSMVGELEGSEPP